MQQISNGDWVRLKEGARTGKDASGYRLGTVEETNTQMQAARVRWHGVKKTALRYGWYPLSSLERLEQQDP